MIEIPGHPKAALCDLGARMPRVWRLPGVDTLGRPTGNKWARILKGNYGTTLEVYLGEGTRRESLGRVVLSVAQGYWEDTLVADHIDRDPTNNTLENLRWVTQSENLRNRVLPSSTSQWPGVAWRKDRSKWSASIQVDGKRRGLGLYHSELDAAVAYLRALTDLGLDHLYPKEKLVALDQLT